MDIELLSVEVLGQLKKLILQNLVLQGVFAVGEEQDVFSGIASVIDGIKLWLAIKNVNKSSTAAVRRLHQ